MRYIPITDADRAAMLAAIGVPDADALFASIPDNVALQRPLGLPSALSEMEIMAELRRMSDRNANLTEHACFLGCGAYDHYIPSVVDHVLRRGEFLTAYTPYQPEISQGVLQSIYEWQTLVCELTGMDVGNASMYDGASALAEAAVMALDLTERRRVVVARSVHPDYRQVVSTYLSGLNADLVAAPFGDGNTDLDRLATLIDDQTAAVLVQTPNFFGCLEPMREIAELAHRHGALLVVGITDPYSLGLLEAPGNYGADIVAMECHPLGNPVSFGGPFVGVIATRTPYMRRLPGRLVGQTLDNRGQRAFVLTLQAREQHIRREKATSNICTNQALNALAATVAMCWLGKDGLRIAAEHSLQKAHYALDQITRLPGWRRAFTAPIWSEFTVSGPVAAAKANQALLSRSIIGGYPLAASYPELPNAAVYCVTEKRTRAEIDALVAGLREVG